MLLSMNNLRERRKSLIRVGPLLADWDGIPSSLDRPGANDDDANRTDNAAEEFTCSAVVGVDRMRNHSGRDEDGARKNQNCANNCAHVFLPKRFDCFV
jgi:hypothetical protein